MADMRRQDGLEELVEMLELKFVPVGLETVLVLGSGLQEPSLGT